MKEFLYAVTFVLLELGSYSLGYATLFRVKFTRNPRPYLFVAIVILVVEGIATWAGKGSIFRDIGTLFCIVIPLLFIERREKKWFLLFLPMVMGISSFDVAMTFVLGLWSGRSEAEIVTDRTAGLFCEFLICLVLFCVRIIQQITKKERKEFVLEKSQYLLFYVGTFCSFILIGCLQMMISGSDLTVQMVNVLGFSIVLICITFLFLSFWHGIVRNSELQYRHQAEQYQGFMRAQEEQIKNIITSDAAMRRYRHDLKAHMTALQALSDRNDNKELKQYIDSMMKDSLLHDTVQYTGNTAIDAVINRILSVSDEKGIKTEINMVLPQEYNISDYELCSIIFNLLQNAVEACEKSEEAGKVEVNLYPYEKSLYLTIRNTVDRPVNINHIHLATTKEDKKNHGLGSINVADIVEKNHGILNYSCEGGWFEVEVII